MPLGKLEDSRAKRTVGSNSEFLKKKKKPLWSDLLEVGMFSGLIAH